MSSWGEKEKQNNSWWEVEIKKKITFCSKPVITKTQFSVWLKIMFNNNPRLNSLNTQKPWTFLLGENSENSFNSVLFSCCVKFKKFYLKQMLIFICCLMGKLLVIMENKQQWTNNLSVWDRLSPACSWILIQSM